MIIEALHFKVDESFSMFAGDLARSTESKKSCDCQSELGNTSGDTVLCHTVQPDLRQ